MSSLLTSCSGTETEPSTLAELPQDMVNEIKKDPECTRTDSGNTCVLHISDGISGEEEGREVFNRMADNVRRPVLC